LPTGFPQPERQAHNSSWGNPQTPGFFAAESIGRAWRSGISGAAVVKRSYAGRRQEKEVKAKHGALRKKNTPASDSATFFS